MAGHDHIVKLGSIIQDEDTPRDAIHVAVIPMLAAEVLAPGTPIGFARSGDTVSVGARTRKVLGIVDPFLDRLVQPGELFYMLLLPNTATNLRHQWSHPDIPDPEPAVVVVDSDRGYDDDDECAC